MGFREPSLHQFISLVVMFFSFFIIFAFIAKSLPFLGNGFSDGGGGNSSVSMDALAPVMTLPSEIRATDISSIKAFAESAKISAIPSTYISLKEPHHAEVADELSAQIPVIDLSLLLSDDPQLHAQAVQDLARACEEWGFFMVINHGIPESLMDEVMSLTEKFHNMSVEEKAEFADKGVSTPIRCGTSFNPKAENVHYWRDYLKVITHPGWAFPHKPEGFNDVAKEYCRVTKNVARKLLEGISESLGLEANAIAKATDFDTGLQVFIANLYPPCPQPELALGMPPHSDHGLLALLIQNGVGGLQINHKGKWVNVNPLPKSILVNTADQLEVASNGRYKSILHRAALNNKETRVSLLIANGPNLENVVAPIPELLEKEEAVFRAMRYKEYFELQQKNKLDGKACVDHIRINPTH
ncbi:flavanone 3-dioxygenase 2-like [Senna tora]|uniref:Flavanone 3-dioxygenase 2-like n=1 Tax=Senna tora TaxID=362788 RepID=A0A834X3S2_9FABA|nr:flavanone 3-dioxygenase 2-like [Senna tora]